VRCALIGLDSLGCMHAAAALPRRQSSLFLSRELGWFAVRVREGHDERQKRWCLENHRWLPAGTRDGGGWDVLRDGCEIKVVCTWS
jgi:hypothetical protein